ncbi:MAG TPA: hypothetical protein VGE74_15825 [Gemmata sp.]
MFGEVLMTIFDELLLIKWPNEFIIEYCDGLKERLLRGEGVAITPPADDPEGIGGISAELPKKHPRNQSIGRCVRFDQLRAIYTTDGRQLWRGAEPGAAPGPAR